MSSQFVFKLIQASLTNDYKRGLAMNPFVTFKADGKRISSKVAKYENRCATWTDDLLVFQSQENVVEVSFKDKGNWLPDMTVATFKIDLHEICGNKGVSRWYPMYDRNNQCCGQIFLYGEHQAKRYAGVPRLEHFTVDKLEQAPQSQEYVQSYVGKRSQECYRDYNVMDHDDDYRLMKVDHWNDDVEMHGLNQM